MNCSFAYLITTLSVCITHIESPIACNLNDTAFSTLFPGLKVKGCFGGGVVPVNVPGTSLKCAFFPSISRSNGSWKVTAVTSGKAPQLLSEV
jgi:hypothetical protein